MDAFPADISEQWLVKAYAAKLDAEIPEPGRPKRMATLRAAITDGLRANVGCCYVNILLPFQPSHAEFLLVQYELGFRGFGLVGFVSDPDSPAGRQICVGPRTLIDNAI